MKGRTSDRNRTVRLLKKVEQNLVSYYWEGYLSIAWVDFPHHCQRLPLFHQLWLLTSAHGWQKRFIKRSRGNGKQVESNSNYSCCCCLILKLYACLDQKILQDLQALATRDAYFGPRWTIKGVSSSFPQSSSPDKKIEKRCLSLADSTPRLTLFVSIIGLTRYSSILSWTYWSRIFFGSPASSRILPMVRPLSSQMSWSVWESTQVRNQIQMFRGRLWPNLNQGWWVTVFSFLPRHPIHPPASSLLTFSLPSLVLPVSSDSSLSNLPPTGQES